MEILYTIMTHGILYDMNTKKLIVGNWKMNPQTLVEAQNIFNTYIATGKTLRNIQVVLAAPSIFISVLKREYRGKKIAFGIQNIHEKEKGAFTGEVSALQAIESGCKYAIIGHAERRAMGETDELVKHKVFTAVKDGLIPIVCVGEKVRDTNAEYLHFVRKQITTALSEIPRSKFSKVVIAYEPVWAIGRVAPSAHEIHQMMLFVRKILVENYGARYGISTTLIYGGAVNKDNIENIINIPDVDGVLVGGASLDGEQFSEIMTVSNEVAKK